jgi:hypothetical protein
MAHPEIQQQRAALLNAPAAWAELEALAKLFEAAVLRGETPAAVAARERLHALLDAYLDLKSEANQVLRNLLRRG